MKNIGIKLLIIWALLVAIFIVCARETMAMSQSDAEHKAAADKYLAVSWDLENGGLTDTADYYWIDKAEAEIAQIEWEALRKDLNEVAHATRVELDKKNPGKLYAANARLTAYCSCSKCCGKWAGGPTASGVMPVEGVTVANGALPFGTKVSINGNVYTVQDRGVGADQFDIYMDSHNACRLFGMQYADVYIVE